MAVTSTLERGPFAMARPVLRSIDVDETREATSRFYADHRLDLTELETPFDARLYSSALGSISFNLMQYGAGVEIEPAPFDFFLVQKPLAGRALVRLGKHHVATRPDTGAIVNGPVCYSVVREPGVRSMAVKIERPRLHRLLEQLLGRDVGEPLEFHPVMRDSVPGQAAWWRLIEYLADETSRADGLLASPALLVEMEQVVMTALLSAQPHNYSEMLQQRESPAAPYYVRRAETFIEANADQPISIEDLIRASGASIRSLQSGFRRFRNTTPMGHIRDVRLSRAREDLLFSEPAETSVTDVAIRWGFFHLGNFAAQYRRKFGELPSETLRQAPRRGYLLRH